MRRVLDGVWLLELRDRVYGERYSVVTRVFRCLMESMVILYLR